MLSSSLFGRFSRVPPLQIGLLLWCHVVAVLSSVPPYSAGHILAQSTLAALNGDSSTVLSLDLYRELWARRTDGAKSPPASAFDASHRPFCTYKHRRGFEVHFTLLRPHQGGHAHEDGAICQEAIYNLEMSEYGHLHDMDAHVPGAMHWLNWHGFSVTQMDPSDLNDRIYAAHGFNGPAIPCILPETPSSIPLMLAQSASCVHVWPRWRVNVGDLFAAMQMPHLLIAFHFYAPYIEAPVKAPLPINWWAAPSVPSDLFQPHHESKDGSFDVSLAFVGLHSALSLFNASAAILLLPGWDSLDMGGDALGKLASLRMLLIHSNAFAIQAVPGLRDEMDSQPSNNHVATSILLGTRAVLRLFADIPLPSSIGHSFLHRVNESAFRMRLPVLSVSAVTLNSGGSGFAAPLAVRIGNPVFGELQRLLKCTDDQVDTLYQHCCLIGQSCETSIDESKSLSEEKTLDMPHRISTERSSVPACPPSTFTMCVAQGWLCRSKPRVVWDSFFFLNELLILKLRLEEIGHLVDKIVIVEATTTYRNGSRPIVIPSAKDVFGEHWHKVVHIVVDDMPAYSDDPWRREYHQRAALMRGLVNASSSDLVLFSDLDEIPRAAVLDAFRWCDEKMPQIMAMQSRVFMHDVNRMKDRWWHAPVVFPVGLMDDALSPKMIRILGHHRRLPWWTNGAWHFTFFGSTSSVKHKLGSFSDGVAEQYKQETSINFRVSHGVHLLDHDKEIGIERLIHPDVDFPSYIVKNPSMFQFTFVENVGEGAHMQPIQANIASSHSYFGVGSWCDGERKKRQDLCTMAPSFTQIVSTCHRKEESQTCSSAKINSGSISPCTQIILMSSNVSLSLIEHNISYPFVVTAVDVIHDLSSCWIRSADAILLPASFNPLSPKPSHQLWIADLSHSNHSNDSLVSGCNPPAWSDAVMCHFNGEIVLVKPVSHDGASSHLVPVSSWAALAIEVSLFVNELCSSISYVATTANRYPWPAVFILYPQWTGQKVRQLDSFRFYTVNTEGKNMNVVVRRDGQSFHVLGGASGNETINYEFEKGVALEQGYHVYQVWLVDHRWRTVSFDDVVFELLPDV